MSSPTSTAVIPTELDEVKKAILHTLATKTSAIEVKAALLGDSGLLSRYISIEEDLDAIHQLSDLVFSRIKDLHTEWDEFRDPQMVDWRRVRGAIEHENLLINHRLTWLFTSQIFLFAFFGAVFTPWIKDEVKDPARHYVPFVLGAVSVLAIIVCLIIQDATRAAVHQIGRLQTWWSAKNPPTTKHPHIQNWRPGVLRRLFWSEFIPLWFVFAWAVLLFGVALDLLYPIKGFIEQYGIILSAVTGILVAVVTISVAITVRVITRQIIAETGYDC
jgi:hypothetical protein